MTVRTAVQLITYPDSLGGDLKALDRVLREYFPDLFPGGVHILPPFPSSGDRGFSPLTYLEIDSQFGNWEDVRRIGARCPVLLDLMVNHVSAQSTYFRDFLQYGQASPYADLFIPLRKIWPNGDPPREDLDKIFLRRSEPFSDFTIAATGQVQRIWTTFGSAFPSEQVDIDVNATIGRKLLTEWMRTFSRNGVKIVRLDAVGYVIKKPGTTCFFVEPEIYGFLEWISGQASSLSMELLPEVHADPSIQFRLAERGFWIYDFILPYRVLEALLNGSSRRLREYLQLRPPRQFTMLDCHDGIPIKPDLNGLYDTEAARRVVAVCRSRGADFSRVMSPGHKDSDGFDVHQILGTFYSLLGCNDDAYLAARAIQLFTPGVPQIYYVGLLAGKNDPSAVERTGDGRELNRHNYTVDEVKRELQRPVVLRLMRLIRLRNEHPAFDGSFRVEDSDDSILALSWAKDRSRCELIVDFERNGMQIRCTKDDGTLADFRL